MFNKHAHHSHIYSHTETRVRYIAAAAAVAVAVVKYNSNEHLKCGTTTSVVWLCVSSFKDNCHFNETHSMYEYNL